MRRIFAVALALLASLIGIAGLCSGAVAQKRVALVIGNSAYKHTGELINPRNDATDVAAALRKHGFNVIEGFDLNKTAFDRKVRDFAIALEGASAGVFFYAGHGLSVGGQNYLVPVDAELTSAVALEFEMVRADVVHRVMERQTTTNILFLDACRDNPLSRNLARSMGTRSTEIGKGLSAVEGGVGTLISFSTQPGNVALDGAGRNSPYAGALAKNIAEGSDDLSAILIAVRNDVMRETQRKQVPWEHSALTGRFYFGASPGAGQATLRPQTNPADLALTEAPASELFQDKDFKRIAALARKKHLPIPSFKIRKPADDVAREVRRFVGVWVTDLGWPSGRQGGLVVTNVDRNGRAVGYTMRSPPMPTSYQQGPAGFFPFAGTIRGGILFIEWTTNSWRVEFTARGHVQVSETYKDGRSGHAEYKRVWTLVDAERSTKP